MYPHRIRLREPWTREPREGGGLRLRRGFHRPTISGEEKVWLVCESPTTASDVSLDGQTLGTVAADDKLWFRDITAQLVDRHELTFDVPATGGDALPWREVRLEIRLHSAPE
jgi:hypothetical protein